MVDSDEETITVPYKEPRVFGAGIRLQKVNFVPASTSSAPATPGGRTEGQSAAERYLAIVQGATAKKEKVDDAALPTPVPTPPPKVQLCEQCKEPMNDVIAKNGKTIPHEASLVHQISLPHSHPPSSVDRSRFGLAVLQGQGWDPDSNLGLGATGEGLRHPIQVKEKHDTAGLGLKLDLSKAKDANVQKKALGPKEILKQKMQDKKKDERLRDSFYRNEDVDKFLGNLG